MRDQSIRVLHVVHSLAVGGLENGVVNLVNGLPLSRFEQAVCCLDLRGDMSARIVRETCIWDLFRRRHDLTVPVKLARIVREWRPHLVHCRNWNTWLDTVIACALSGIGPSLVWSFHGFADMGKFPLRRRFASRILARRSDRLLAVCRNTADQYAGLTGISPARFEILHNGVDCDRFRPTADRHALRRELQLPEHELIVATVANLTIIKNHASLLRAASRICSGSDRQVRFLFFGDGPERARLLALSRELGIAERIILYGTTQQIDKYLPAVDLFVLPSRNEGLSNAILEAMACGVPVVATEVGGNSDLVSVGRTGYLCPPDDVNSLAGAMDSLLSDESMRSSMGYNSRQDALARFSLSTMLARYGDFYESCIPRKAAATPTAGGH
ncbi:glycosyltransferase [Candidatus Accumulibacter sp. ACC003]|uniref:glycosyltransferase n=1 Tax=Candidatus Accumulibacter sp. ACC003 TaxID=2823334 RepID=UPI0025BE26B1|nr:glycosyltransferase [Candidatus Accumulibacter sp. ACC003]